MPVTVLPGTGDLGAGFKDLGNQLLSFFLLRERREEEERAAKLEQQKLDIEESKRRATQGANISNLDPATLTGPLAAFLPQTASIAPGATATTATPTPSPTRTGGVSPATGQPAPQQLSDTALANRRRLGQTFGLVPPDEGANPAVALALPAGAARAVATAQGGTSNVPGPGGSGRATAAGGPMAAGPAAPTPMDVAGRRGPSGLLGATVEEVQKHAATQADVVARAEPAAFEAPQARAVSAPVPETGKVVAQTTGLDVGQATKAAAQDRRIPFLTGLARQAAAEGNELQARAYLSKAGEIAGVNQSLDTALAGSDPKTRQTAKSLWRLHASNPDIPAATFDRIALRSLPKTEAQKLTLLNAQLGIRQTQNQMQADAIATQQLVTQGVIPPTDVAIPGAAGTLLQYGQSRGLSLFKEGLIRSRPPAPGSAAATRLQETAGLTQPQRFFWNQYNNETSTTLSPAERHEQAATATNARYPGATGLPPASIFAGRGPSPEEALTAVQSAAGLINDADTLKFLQAQVPTAAGGFITDQAINDWQQRVVAENGMEPAQAQLYGTYMRRYRTYLQSQQPQTQLPQMVQPGAAGAGGVAPTTGAAPTGANFNIDLSAPGTATAGFDTTAAMLMPRLQSTYGLTRAQAAGVVGSLAHESAGFEAIQEANPVGGGRGGLGWAQWTASRRRDFERWAAEQGLPTDSFAANWGFLQHELAGPEGDRVLGKLRATDTVTGAQRVWTDTFERPGVKAYGSRNQFAARAANTTPITSTGTVQPATATQPAAPAAGPTAPAPAPASTPVTPAQPTATPAPAAQPAGQPATPAAPAAAPQVTPAVISVVQQGFAQGGAETDARARLAAKGYTPDQVQQIVAQARAATAVPTHAPITAADVPSRGELPAGAGSLFDVARQRANERFEGSPTSVRTNNVVVDALNELVGGRTESAQAGAAATQADLKARLDGLIRQYNASNVDVERAQLLDQIQDVKTRLGIG